MHSCYYFVGSDQTFCLQSLCLLITVSLLEFYEKGKNMSGNLMDLTQANFENETAQGLTLVDFWAPWCGPCRMQTPILEKVSAKMGSGVKICKVNIDDEQDIAANFGIQSIPTLLLFKDGQLLHKMVGLQNESALLSALQNA